MPKYKTKWITEDVVSIKIDIGKAFTIFVCVNQTISPNIPPQCTIRSCVVGDKRRNFSIGTSCRVGTNVSAELLLWEAADLYLVNNVQLVMWNEIKMS